MSTVFKALSDPTRRTVLQHLQRGPMGAGELAELFDVSKPTMSAHFSVLVAAGLIDADKQGRTVTYRLKLSVLEDALLSFAQAFGLQVTRPNTDKTGKPAVKAHPSIKPRKDKS